jgi:hypothetical protein
MVRIFTVLLSVMFFSSCGDLLDEEKMSAGEEPIQGSGTITSSSPEGVTGAGSSGKAAPSCLTDCDNGIWSSLIAESLPLADAINIEGCLVSRSAAFARSPNIEILSVLNCSGLESLYLWTVNNLGAVAAEPQKIDSCLLGEDMLQLRRSVGKNGVLTAWVCSKQQYYDRYSYFVRTEQLSGAQISRTRVSGIGSGMQVAYNAEVDLWGVGFTGLMFRFSKSGLLSGSTSWSTYSNTSIQGFSVRDGVFQIMEGSSANSATYCSRVTAGGGMLCKANEIDRSAHSVAPISGSRFLLIQSGDMLSLGSDSPSSCQLTGTAQTFARHREYQRLLRALLVEGTPYVAALADVSGKLMLNLIQTSPAMVHLTSIPLADANEWFSTHLNLFVVGELIYVTFQGQNGLKVMTIPKPEVSK